MSFYLSPELAGFEPGLTKIIRFDSSDFSPELRHDLAENVAQHSLCVKLRSLRFGKDHSRLRLNLAKLENLSLLHDIGEIITGDQVAYMKKGVSPYPDNSSLNKLGLTPGQISLITEEHLAKYYLRTGKKIGRFTREAIVVAVEDTLAATDHFHLNTVRFLHQHKEIGNLPKEKALAYAPLELLTYLQNLQRLDYSPSFIQALSHEIWIYLGMVPGWWYGNPRVTIPPSFEKVLKLVMAVEDQKADLSKINLDKYRIGPTICQSLLGLAFKFRQQYSRLPL